MSVSKIVIQKSVDTINQNERQKENVPSGVRVSVGPQLVPVSGIAPDGNINAAEKEKKKLRLGLMKLKKTTAVEFSFPDQAVLMKGYQKKFAEKKEINRRMMMSVNLDSELYKKEKNANDLLREVKKATIDRQSNMLSVMKDKAVDCEEQTWNDLSYFIDVKDKKASDAFVDHYLGTVSEDGAYRKGDITEALKTVVFKIMETDLSGLHIETDEKMIENAGRLEHITGMLAAFDRLMEKHPDFATSLEVDEWTCFLEHCDLLRAIASYYIARSELLKDPYYRCHLREELSPDSDKESAEEQKIVSGKIVNAFVLGNALRKKAGLDVSVAPNGLLVSVAAQEMMEKAKELADSREKQKALIASYDKTVPNCAKKYMLKTNYQIKKMEMVLDVDSFLETLRSKQELEVVRLSVEAKQVSRNIQALQAFLSNEMPPIKRDKNGKLDKTEEAAAREEINNNAIIIAMLYNRLNDSIDAMIKANVENADVARMYSGLKKNCKKDSELFKGKAIEYRDFMIADPEFGKKNATWNDALKHTRSAFYDLDSKNVTYKREGEGSSLLYAITPQNASGGSQTVYFRKEDKVPSRNSKVMIKNVLEFYELSTEESQVIKTGLEEVCSTIISMSNMQAYVIKMKKMKFSPKEIGENVVKNIGSFKGLVSNANKEKYGHIFIDFADSVAKRNMAMEIKKPAKINYGRKLSNRNVATSRLAAMLGVSDMICDSRTASIKQNGKVVKGNIMEATGGVEPDRAGGIYSSHAISQLFTLSVFDLICGQTDRHFGNYHCIINKKDVIEGIKGIDNDMAFGELRFEDIKDGYNWIRNLTYDALIALPTSFINRLMALTQQYLQQALGDLLSIKELSYLWDRISGVKINLIRLTEKKGTNCSWDKEKQKFEFKGEDKDDKLRQLKCLKDIKSNMKVKNAVEIRTMFVQENLNLMNFDDAITRRKNELQKEQKEEGK